MTENMVYFLKDSEINNWLVKGFADRNFPIVFYGINNADPMISKSRIFRIFSLHTHYIKLSLKGLFKSGRNDVIITFLDVMGLYLVLISKLFFLKRKIIVINIMFNDNNDAISKIKKIAFRFMLKDSSVFPTITSTELEDIYRSTFKLSNKKFLLLNDCYGKLENYKYPFKSKDDYVLSGGSNGRDWQTLVKTAKILPHINFVIVGPQANTLGEDIPPNIKFFHNIKFEEFQKLLLNCRICTLPLNTQAPAGLIVLFAAGLMSKPVITTDNITMREYINSGDNGILIEPFDHIELANEIEKLYYDTIRQKKLGEKLFETVNHKGSPEKYIDDLIRIIQIAST
jgi:glycosyltransferase involved in cell wall biosynthesis